MRAPATAALLVLLLAGDVARGVAQAPEAGEGDLAAGDRTWAERSYGEGDGARADREAVARAVAAYRRAAEAAPDDLGVWDKLLGALYFQGEYVAADTDERREAFDRGKEAAEEALGRLAGLAGVEPKKFRDLDPDERVARLRAANVEPAPAATLFFWSGVHWGLWGDAYGRFAAAREGVAGTVRDDALTALALDPTVERAGPHRVLGRLHAEAPKIPFFTGWVDRDLAIAELESAVETAPGEPLNRLYLAEALLDYRPERAADARAQLHAVLDRPGEADRVVEWADAKRRAREILEEQAP